jgi:hypothetical protein
MTAIDRNHLQYIIMRSAIYGRYEDKASFGPHTKGLLAFENDDGREPANQCNIMG